MTNEQKLSELGLIHKAVRNLPGMTIATLSLEPQPQLLMAFHDIVIDLRVKDREEGLTTLFYDELGRFRNCSFDDAVEEIEWNLNLANTRFKL